MKITLKRSFMAVLCVVGMSSFVACDEDDDTLTPPVFHPTAENGSYTGTMSYELPAVPAPLAATETAVGFDATQNSIGQDSLVFAEFPVAGLVTAVVGEDAAAEIIAGLGKVRFATPYSATESTDKKEVSISVKPSVLTLNLPNETEPTKPMVVKVFVSAPKDSKAKYVVADKTMTYDLVADSVYVGPMKFPFTPMTLNFTGTKKK